MSVSSSLGSWLQTTCSLRFTRVVRTLSKVKASTMKRGEQAADDDAVHTVGHVLGHEFPAFVPAKAIVLFTELDLVFVGGDIAQRCHVQSAADVAPATEVYG